MWRTIIVALALICLGLMGYYAVTKRAVQISAGLAASANAAVAGKVAGVRVEVTQRDARLVGSVGSEASKAEAERVALGVSGVKSVKNDLVVEAPRPEEVKGPEAPPVKPEPPLELKVAWDGAVVTASGALPVDLEKDLGLIYMTDFPDAPVKDTVAPTATAATRDQVIAFKAAVKALARTRSGAVSVTATELHLTGVVGSTDEEAALKKLLADVGGGLVPKVELTVAVPAVVEDEGDAGVAEAADAVVEDVAPDAGAAPSAEGPLTGAQCQAAIAALVEGDKRIAFKPNSGRLTDEDDAKLQVIWGILQRCPDTKGSILAFSDDLGEPDRVRQLTQARAFNVHKRLTELGMDKGRLEYRGMGQREFKYPNQGETRVLNQRIEFRLEVQ